MENDPRNDVSRSKKDDTKGACPDSKLLPQEQCCCSALQRLASPYLFGFLVCLLSLFQSAASTGTG